MEEECCVCLETVFLACPLSCGHRNHCAHCLLRLANLARRSDYSVGPRCPTCRASFREEDIDIAGLQSARAMGRVPVTQQRAVESALEELFEASEPRQWSPQRRRLLPAAVVMVLVSSAARFVFPEEAMVATALARTRALDNGSANFGWGDHPSYSYQIKRTAAGEHQPSTPSPDASEPRTLISPSSSDARQRLV